MTNNYIVERLNHLINIAEDGAEGYKNAAQDVDNEAIKNSFLVYSKDRSLYASELRQLIFQLNGEAEDGEGGTLGTLHRVWMDVKAVLTSGDSAAVINACITGEEAAIKEYKQVLDDVMVPESYKKLLAEQLHGIEQSLVSIRSKVHE